MVSIHCNFVMDEGIMLKLCRLLPIGWEHQMVSYIVIE